MRNAVRLGAALAAAVICGGLPAVAVAAPASLSGESLSVTENVQGPPFPFVLTCGNWSNPGPHFAFSGTATGPYPGPFTEKGKAVYPAECDGPSTQIPITSYTAKFTITTVHATVSGTETMTGSATATAVMAAGGGGVTVGPVSTKYTATITKPHSICTDTGTSTATVGQSVIQGMWWVGSLKDGPLTSTGTLHCRSRS